MSTDTGVKMSRYRIFQCFVRLKYAIQKGGGKNTFSDKELESTYYARPLMQKGYLAKVSEAGSEPRYQLTEKIKSALVNDTTLMRAIITEIIIELQEQTYAAQKRKDFYQRLLAEELQEL